MTDEPARQMHTEARTPRGSVLRRASHFGSLSSFYLWQDMEADGTLRTPRGSTPRAPGTDTDAGADADASAPGTPRRGSGFPGQLVPDTDAGADADSPDASDAESQAMEV